MWCWFVVGEDLNEGIMGGNGDPAAAGVSDDNGGGWYEREAMRGSEAGRRVAWRREGCWQAGRQTERLAGGR